MQREIKFKAWDKLQKKWFRTSNTHANDDDVSDLAMHANVIYLMSSITEPHNDEQYDFLQFTGLKDKNGKEIYEGYILRDPKGIGVVYFYPPSFVVQTREEEPYALAKGKVNVKQLEETEIIGNIYENPDLLK